MEYTAENRGKPQYVDRMKQVISFEGMNVLGNITPTDIDGYFEIHGEIFVFFEMKLEGCCLPEGQRLALTRNVDYLQSAGREAVLFVCTHNVIDKTQPVMAKDAKVQKIYYKGKITDLSHKNYTLKFCVEKFVAQAQKQRSL